MSRPVAYLTSVYPAVSHTFISREVRALRARGMDVHTFTIRRAPAGALVSGEDREEAARTSAILPIEVSSLLRHHLAAAGRHPVRYAMTMLTALAMSPGGARATLWQLFYFAEAIELWSRCEARGIRHIHAHFANVASAVAMLAARFGAAEGASWSFTMHGQTEFDDVSRYALAEKVDSARFVACISDYCRSQLMRHVSPQHWDKLTIVRCGLELQSSRPPERQATDPERFAILCVGRLVPDKGQVLLLEAVAELRRRGLDAHLTLVGDGPDRRRLESERQRADLGAVVTLCGSLNQAQIHDLLAHSDVFCLPSFAEGLPVVIMEAFAAAVPVVTTRVGGIAELVEDGRSGALVAPGRVDLLVDALARVAADRELARAWGENGRARVVAQHDITHSARQLAELFAGA